MKIFDEGIITLNNGDKDIEKLIDRMGRLDKRLESFDAYLVSVILKYEAENGI